MWGEDQTTLISSAYAPVGRLTAVDGGYELSGQWGFSSGCDHASWALLGAMVVGMDGRPVDFMTVLVPRTDYEIRDVWDVVGMRGTASNEIVVDKAFVPERRLKRNYETAQLRVLAKRSILARCTNFRSGVSSPRRLPLRVWASSPVVTRGTWT